MTLPILATQSGESTKEQLTLFAEDSHAKHSALQENEKDLMMFVEQCSSILPTRLNRSNHAIFCLRTSKVYSITKKGELSEQSSARWMNSGMMSNGICITAKITEFPKTESVSILSDILENTVDEKFYLSDEKTEQLLARVNDTVPTLRANTHGNESEVVEPKILRVIDGKKELGYSSQDVYSTDGLCNTLNTMGGGGREPKILTVGNIRKNGKSQSGQVVSAKGIAPTVNAVCYKDPTKILIKEATKKGYAEASVGDSVNYSIPTSKTRRGRVGKGVANTLDTGCQQGVVVRDMRIRKLTPLECWRLQGFPDELFYKAQAVNSNSQLYKQAGNSVTVNVAYDVAKHITDDWGRDQ